MIIESIIFVFYYKYYKQTFFEKLKIIFRSRSEQFNINKLYNYLIRKNCKKRGERGGGGGEGEI